MKTGYKVVDAMTVNPIIIGIDISVEDCAKVMEKKHVGALLIGDKDNIKGIITEQDIVRKIIGKGMNPLDKKVNEFMETKLMKIEPEKDIFDALVIMKDENIRHLPVFDGDKFSGLLTLKDILKIQPSLFDFMVEKFELREEKRKPIFKPKPEEGICQVCGNYSEQLFNVDDSLVCESCKDQ